MWIILLSALVFISAILPLRAEYMGLKRGIYVFKPLTMVFIILIALQTKTTVSPFYKYTIAC